MRSLAFTPSHVAEKPCLRCGLALWIYEGDDASQITHCSGCKGREDEPMGAARKRRKKGGWRYNA
jgi:hypothetical protein